uniref:NADH-ubiquinone oxidoreductase chain 4 n=1 Tax=Proboscidactyla flavicirrata TaxID=323328 RepID=A0A0S2IBG4_9CNID|nr:NADH dehydrogenase subunit 4 [Proboscidactyla flavicirrata]
MIQIILISFLAIINILFINKKKDTTIKKVSLFWSIVILFIYILIILNYNQILGEQSILNFFWIDVFSFKWGPSLFNLDGISIILIGLAILLKPICILLTWFSDFYNKKEFYILLFTIIFPVVLFFSSSNLMIFYITFETTLIPMFLMIGIWGYRQEKIRAAYYFFFYTLIGSLLMLLSIFKIYNLTGTLNYHNLLTIEIPEYLQFWLFLGFFLSFAVKIPMFPLHIWLPRAHVEAPITGSVLLAGILLKLGGYGFLRFSYTLFPLASNYFSPFIICLSLIAIIYGSLTTCRQSDMKTLIAYSSVAHMGLVTLSIFTHSFEGIIASIAIMVAHGLVSPALFISTSVLYARHHTRAIKYYKGLTVSMPIFACLTLILFLANISFPLTFNFIAEFFSVLCAFKYSKLVGLLSCVGMLLGTVYSLYYFNRVYFGNISLHLEKSRDIIRSEFNVFVPLIIITIFLGVYPNFFINFINFNSYINISL